jgi:hypothetical protein
VLGHARRAQTHRREAELRGGDALARGREAAGVLVEDHEERAQAVRVQGGGEIAQVRELALAWDAPRSETLRKRAATRVAVAASRYDRVPAGPMDSPSANVEMVSMSARRLFSASPRALSRAVSSDVPCPTP